MFPDLMEDHAMWRLPSISAISLTLAMALFCHDAPAQEISSFNRDNSSTSMAGTPKGWTFGGNAVNRYRTWTDIAQGLPGGGRCSIIATDWHFSTGTHLRSPDVPANQFATVMQAISAQDYRGKRVRFSAQLSSVEVVGQAGLWMRVDGENGKVLKFDDMGSRPVNGTTPWTGYDVVLDIPAESAVIQFGYLLAGEGKVKAAAFRLEVVDASTPPTAAGVPKPDENLSKTPRNLEIHL